jgi:molecular chaperone GrpE (heat shock protein)
LDATEGSVRVMIRAQPETPLPDQQGQSVEAGTERPADTRSEPDSVVGTHGHEPEFPAALAGIELRLDQLQALFETKILDDEQHRQWYAGLTSELEAYRQDFVFKHVTSKVFRDLIQLYDTVNQTLDAAVLGTASRDDLVSRFEILRKGLLRTLSRQDVGVISAEVGTPFDETEQEAIDVRPVDRPEDDGTVLEVARPGFRYGSRILRPQSVIVGRYESKDGGRDA